MSMFGGVPLDQPDVQPITGSRFGGVAIEPPTDQPAKPDTGFLANYGVNFLDAANRRRIGLEQTARDLGEALYGASPQDTSEKAAATAALQQLDQEKKTVNNKGVGSVLGAVAGDPVSYIPGVGSGMKGLAATGAIIGGASGLTSGQQDDNGVLQRAGQALRGAAIGAPTAVLAGKATELAANGLGKLLTTSSPLGIPAALVRPVTGSLSDATANDYATSSIAKQLLKEGMAPEQLQKLVTASEDAGLGATLPETTKSRALLGRQKAIAQSSGEAGTNLTNYLEDRATTQVPSAIEDFGNQLAANKELGSNAYQNVFESAGDKPLDTSDAEADLAKRMLKVNSGDKTQVNALQSAADILASARQQGNSLEALHNAKIALDNIGKDAPNPGSERIAANAVNSIKQKLLSSMDTAYPEYAGARSTYQQGLAGDKILDALNTTRDGSIAALRGKLFGSPEARQELQNMVTPEQFGQFQKLMNSAKDIQRGGISGSDTAQNFTVGKELANETGAPLTELAATPWYSPAKIAEAYSNLTRPRDYNALQQQFVSPDIDAIAGKMNSIQNVNNAAQTAGQVAGRAVSQQGGLPQQPPPVPFIPQPTAAPVLPAPQPQASRPLIDRITQAESGGNPDAQNPNSSASGPLQFTNGTWAQMVAKYGKQTGITLAMKNDPQAQATMGELLAQDNAKIMTGKLGRPPTDGELYAAHFFGAPDVMKLINATQATPDKQAIMLYPRKMVNDNRSIFFDGNRPRTVSEVYQLMNDKVSG